MSADKAQPSCQCVVKLATWRPGSTSCTFFCAQSSSPSFAVCAPSDTSDTEYRRMSVHTIPRIIRSSSSRIISAEYWFLMPISLRNELM